MLANVHTCIYHYIFVYLFFAKKFTLTIFYPGKCYII